MGIFQIAGTLRHEFFQAITVEIQLLFQFLFRGDVLLNARVMADAAIRLSDRRDMSGFQIFPAILGAIPEFAFPGLSLGERVP